jgi:hypothetical protein
MWHNRVYDAGPTRARGGLMRNFRIGFQAGLAPARAWSFHFPTVPDQ